MKRPTRTRRTAAASAPSGITRASLVRADRDLVQAIDAALARAARRAGEHLACHVGCSECCHGPFPINRLDAWRLREGLEDLRRRDPDRAAAIETRAREALETLRPGFPGDAAAGRLGGDEAAEDRYFEEHAGLACPALDPSTQACDLYAHRPVSCRTYGPPVRFGGEDLPPCRLCFTAAEAGKVEACRVEPDPDHLERAIVDRLKRDDGDASETLIASALAGPPPGRGR